MKNIFVSLLLMTMLAFSACQVKQDPRYLMEEHILSLYHDETISPEAGDDKLQEWLLNDSTTMDYEFQKLLGINKAASNDGKFVVYSWYMSRYIFRTVVQYIGDDGFHSFDYGLISYSDEESDDKVGSITTLVQSIKDDEGRILYLTHSYGSSNHPFDGYHHQWAVYAIENDSLVTVPYMFEDELKGIRTDKAEFHYHHWEWAARNHDENVLRLPRFYDTSERSFWLPETDEFDSMTDKYYRYTFDGEVFRTTNIPEMSPLVTSKLDGYKCQVLVYSAEEVLLRIDKMPDGTYRYASWREWSKDENSAVMCSKPNIILTGGTYNEMTHRYYFYNGKYCYIVPDIDWDGHYGRRGIPCHDKLVITYDGEPKTEYTIYCE